MITGRQIREGRRLANMQAWRFAKATGVSTADIFLAGICDDEPPIAPGQIAAIQQALETAGIKFTCEDGAVSVRVHITETPPS